METVLRLTPSQRSALECAGLEPSVRDGDSDELVARAWFRPTTLAYFTVTPETRERLASALTALANAEDDNAIRAGDPATRRQARGACVALSNLATAVARC